MLQAAPVNSQLLNLPIDAFRGVISYLPSYMFFFDTLHRVCKDWNQELRDPRWQYKKILSFDDLVKAGQNNPTIAGKILNTPSLFAQLDGDSLFTLGKHNLYTLSKVVVSQEAVWKMDANKMALLQESYKATRERYQNTLQEMMKGEERSLTPSELATLKEINYGPAVAPMEISEPTVAPILSSFKRNISRKDELELVTEDEAFLEDQDIALRRFKRT
jgi:hypothetical protein